MNIGEKQLVRIVESKYFDYYVSVKKWNEESFEIAVIEYDKFYKRSEIDYSIFNDVFHASSLMEVYGIVEYKIKPAYIA